MREGQLCSDDEISDLEAQNGLRQFDAIRSLFARSNGELGLDRQVLQDLNHVALDGIYSWAGEFRREPVHISNSSHEPPDFYLVPSLVDGMCEYANSVSGDPLHCSAFLMWRLNWIHPFSDGNGRTSRAISYLALCVGNSLDLPGTLTVPDQITRSRGPYYAALEQADEAWKRGKINVSMMERLIEFLLVKQLESAV